MNPAIPGAKKQVASASDLGAPVAYEPPLAGLTRQDIEARWPEVLETVRKRKRSTHAFLLEGRPVALEKDVVTIVFKEGYSFHRDKVEQAENRGTVEEALGAVFQVPLKLKTLMEADIQERPMAGDAEEIVQKAVDMFGADVVVIKE